MPPSFSSAELLSTVDTASVFVPQIDYVTILGVVACAMFFAKGAELEHRSPLVWGGLSLAMWIGFTTVFVGGIVGGLLSQALLFLGLTAVELFRNRTAPNRRN